MQKRTCSLFVLLACCGDDARSPARRDASTKPQVDAATALDGGSSAADASVESDAAPDAGDAGVGTPSWKPLSTNAMPYCTHAAAPSDYDPAAYGVFRSLDSMGQPDRILMLGAHGEPLVLSCDDHTDVVDERPAPDRRKIMYWRDSNRDAHYVTSWLLDGVFALPTELEGFSLVDYFWLNDDWLFATGLRVENGLLVENARFVVRWDASVSKRLVGEQRRMPGRASEDIYFGDNQLAVYRADSDQPSGFDYYTLRFPDLSMEKVASNLGDFYLSNGEPVDFVHEKLFVAGNGTGADGFFMVDLQTKQVTDFQQTTAGRAYVSPDGRYLVLSAQMGIVSRAVAGGELHAYPTVLDSPVFEPQGHRFAASDNFGGVVVVDPATGLVGPDLAPTERASPDSFVEGAQYVVLRSEEHTWFSTPNGPAQVWTSGAVTSLVYTTPLGAVLSYYYAAKDGSYVAFRGQPERLVPGTENSKGLAVGWSFDGKTTILNIPSYMSDGKVLLWHPGDASSLDLQQAASDALGYPVLLIAGVALHSMLL